MANQINDYPLIIDIESGELIANFRSAQTIPARDVVQGDELRVLLRAVGRHPIGQVALTQLWQDIALPAQIYVGVGTPGRKPTSGSLKLSFGADTTASVAHNAPSSAVQAALNSLTSVTSAGGVTVSGEAGGPWQVAFNENGARSSIVAVVDALYPISEAHIFTARDGTSELTEIQVISLECQAAALAIDFDDFPTAAVTIIELQEGAAGVPGVQRVSISNDTYGGTFTLVYSGEATAAIPYDASADEVQSALEALEAIGAGNAVVTGTSPEWTITFQGELSGAVETLSGSAVGLNVPIGKIGLLNLATAGIEQLLNGAPSVDAVLEVQAMHGGSSAATILQTPLTVYNDQISNAPGAPAGLPSYLTATASDARYPRYDQPQSLTPEQKAQVLDNILADLAITTGKLADLAVTSGKLADLAVISGKLADLAVITAKINDLAVTSGKLADLAVTTAKINDLAVTSGKLADNAVTSAKVPDDGLPLAKLQLVRAALTTTVSSSASAADLDVLSVVVGANRLAAGDVIHFQMAGTFSVTTGVLNLWIKRNSVKSNIISSSSGSFSAGTPFVARGVLAIRSSTEAILTLSIGVHGSAFLHLTPQTLTIDTTASITLVLGCNVGNSSGALSVTQALIKQD